LLKVFFNFQSLFDTLSPLQWGTTFERSALARVKIAPPAGGRGLRSSKLRIQSSKCKPLPQWRKFF
jgi:hypothetical protein